MTLRRRTTCRDCGRPISAAEARLTGLGSTCIKELSEQQIKEAIELTRLENSPGYVPPDKAPTGTALATNAAARRAIEEAQAPDTCHHFGVKGECLRCRQENDLGWCVQQVIAGVQADRERGVRRPLRPWPLPYVRHANPWSVPPKHPQPGTRPRSDTGQLALEIA